MKRFTLLLVVLLALSIQAESNAQYVPNPTGIAGSFTSTGGTENEHVISVSRLTTDNKVMPAQFIYKFVVSDTCRLVMSYSTQDAKFKPDHQVDSDADDYTVTYIPLVTGIEYSIDCNATHIKIFRAGTSTTITYSGIVEYE